MMNIYRNISFILLLFYTALGIAEPTASQLTLRQSQTESIQSATLKSFFDEQGNQVNCIPFETQPAFRQKDGSYKMDNFSKAMLKAIKKNHAANIRNLTKYNDTNYCDPGQVPFLKSTLGKMTDNEVQGATKFMDRRSISTTSSPKNQPSLLSLEKKPSQLKGGGTISPEYYYWVRITPNSTAAVYGGGGDFNVWPVNYQKDSSKAYPQGHTVTQIWMGNAGKVRQPLEGGIGVLPWMTENKNLLVFWLLGGNKDYATGCWNQCVNKRAWVQYSNVNYPGMLIKDYNISKPGSPKFLRLFWVSILSNGLLPADYKHIWGVFKGDNGENMDFVLSDPLIIHSGKQPGIAVYH